MNSETKTMPYSTLWKGRQQCAKNQRLRREKEGKKLQFASISTGFSRACCSFKIHWPSQVLSRLRYTIIEAVIAYKALASYTKNKKSKSFFRSVQIEKINLSLLTPSSNFDSSLDQSLISIKAKVNFTVKNSHRIDRIV